MSYRHLIVLIDRDMAPVHYVVMADDFGVPEGICRNLTDTWAHGDLAGRMEYSWSCNGIGSQRVFADQAAVDAWRSTWADTTYTVTHVQTPEGELITTVKGVDAGEDMVYFTKVRRDMESLYQISPSQRPKLQEAA